MSNDKNLLEHATSKIDECRTMLRVWQTKLTKWENIAKCKTEDDAKKTRDKFRMIESLIKKGIPNDTSVA